MDLSNKSLSLQRINFKHKKNCKYPVEKRIECVTKWMALGNMRLVADLTGVSYQLLREWKTASWWGELVDEIRASRSRTVDTKLSKLVDKSLEAVGDRLENGDLVWNRKEQSLERIPVSALTAHKIANDLLQRQGEIQKQESLLQVEKDTTSVKDQLAMLASEFAKFNTKRTVDVVSKEVISALHEERETGLQERIRTLPFSPRTNQESTGTELSQSSGSEGGESSQGGWDGRRSQETFEQGWDEQDVEFESSDEDSESELFENEDGED